ncbi:MAG: aldo/keto reductase [Caldilineaceae bacterium]
MDSRLSRGESESTLGNWIKQRKNRNELFIGTKVGGPYQDTPFGLRSNLIEQECEKSLKRLGVDTIDLYYSHIDDRTTPFEETLEAFDKLVKAGKVRFIGACNHQTWRYAEARCISQSNGWTQYTAIEQRYTYLRPRQGAQFEHHVVINHEMLDYCTKHKVTLLAYAVLLKGAYTRVDRTIPEQYIGPDTDSRLATLLEVSKELAVSPNQVIIAWLRQSQPAILPIIAASTKNQLIDNINSLNITLTREQMDRLNSAGS